MRRVITVMLYIAFIALIILFSMLVAKWIWGSDLPGWLKVLMIAG